jgi:bifunctional DNA-binding transcriptional regulator/antitoxin component of YhaV-PrlF toxin-antitoxin module
MTLPREIRERFDVNEGDKIAFVRRGGETVVIPMRQTLLQKRGSVKVSKKQDFEAIRKEVRSRRA